LLNLEANLAEGGLSMNSSVNDFNDRRKKVTQALLGCSKHVEAEVLFPVMVPGAAEIITSNPYAFSIATCLDRGTKADIIWTIPYDINKKLGHLDPYRFYKMSLEELADLFTSLPRRPRYVNDAPRTIHDLTRIVVEECGGDAAKIWTGKHAAEVNRTFRSIYGVGPGIANLAVLLIEQAFLIRFDDLDRPHMDIKPDVHTKRVLYRLGMSDREEETAAIEATRRMNPSWPGELDGALWWIGRYYCRPTNPACGNCPLSSECEKHF
jgi:endonuclease III